MPCEVQRSTARYTEVQQVRLAQKEMRTRTAAAIDNVARGLSIRGGSPFASRFAPGSTVRARARERERAREPLLPIRAAVASLSPPVRPRDDARAASTSPVRGASWQRPGCSTDTCRVEHACTSRRVENDVGVYMYIIGAGMEGGDYGKGIGVRVRWAANEQHTIIPNTGQVNIQHGQPFDCMPRTVSGWPVYTNSSLVGARTKPFPKTGISTLTRDRHAVHTRR